MRGGIQRTGRRTAWSAAAAAPLLACVLGVAVADPLPPARPTATEPAKVSGGPAEPPKATGAPAEPPAPTFAKGRDLYLPMVAAEAGRLGLPAEVADAVMRVESNYDPLAVGGVGERGLMQVLPSTAAMLGFRGTPDELADPLTNIRLGVRYLAGAWKLSAGDLCRTLMKYRAGHNEERMSALSVAYCRRARAHLAALGSPLAGGELPAAEFGSGSGSGGAASFVRVRRFAAGRPAGLASRRSSRGFWAAHTARIRAIEARLPWRRGGIMAGS